MGAAWWRGSGRTELACGAGPHASGTYGVGRVGLRPKRTVTRSPSRQKVNIIHLLCLAGRGQPGGSGMALPAPDAVGTSTRTAQACSATPQWRSKPHAAGPVRITRVMRAPERSDFLPGRAASTSVTVQATTGRFAFEHGRV